METGIAFAAGMVLTLIALALEDWTRVNREKNENRLHKANFAVPRMLLSMRERNPVASGQKLR